MTVKLDVFFLGPAAAAAGPPDVWQLVCEAFVDAGVMEAGTRDL